MRRHVILLMSFVTVGLVVVGGTPGGAADNGSVTGTVTAKGLSTNADIVVSLEAAGLAVKPASAAMKRGSSFGISMRSSRSPSSRARSCASVSMSQRISR